MEIIKYFNRKERKDFAQRSQRIRMKNILLCVLCLSLACFAVNGFHFLWHRTDKIILKSANIQFILNLYSPPI